jgi:glycosyltransferase involved in cell wall biosynthesis
LSGRQEVVVAQQTEVRRHNDIALLLVADSLRDNGGLRVALEYARQWRAMRARLLVGVVQDVDDVALAQPDPTVPYAFMTPRNTRFRYTWPLALFRLIAQARHADVVMAASETGIGLLLGFLTAKIVRRPFAVLVQADLDDSIATWVTRSLQRATRFVHAHADVAVSVADSVVPGIVANGLPAERVRVVMNGIDVAHVRELAGLPPVDGATPEPMARRAEGPPSIVGHGRLSVQKDFTMLVRAHAKVRAAGIDHRLVIIGEGPAKNEIAAVVAQHGVQDSVQLAGYVDNPYPITSKADLFVLSSRTEGMPLTILEALAVGAPIVATRCATGVERLLDGGKYGELVPPGDVDAMASAIERHLRDPAPLREAAAHGPRWALTFDVARSASTILETLRALTRKRH